MKKILFLLAALFSLGLSQGYAQALKTVRTYYDLFSTRPYEVYTVNARTGQKHGTYNLYMEDGTLGITMTYANGALNGLYRQYGFADGSAADQSKPRIEANYLNDKLQGHYMEYMIRNGQRKPRIERTYDKGIIVEETTWHESTGAKEEYSCMNGVNRSWYENGKPYRKCQVVKGLPNGKFVEYHPDGSIAEISYYKNGELDGKLEKYYENGQLRTIQHFVDGKLTGEMVGYHSDGRLAEKYTFEIPGEVATCVLYFANGNKRSETTRTGDNEFLTIRYDSITASKTAELVQNWHEASSNSDEGTEVKVYRADGTLHKSWTRNGSKRYRACTYDEKGELESLYDYDGTLVYVFPGTEIVSQRIKPADYKGHYPYECYDREGNIIEKGKMDSDDNKLTVTKYENGRSVYERADNGDEYWRYPNGNRKAYASADRSYIVMYDEQERWIGCRSKEGYNCVYRYPNSSVKAKGEEDAAGNRIGKWYLYSETGRLSVEENGVVRKPTKEEKASHESYLQELVDAKR